MSYEIVWKESAENELIELWLAARDRQRIQETLDSLEPQLASQPYEIGEARHAFGIGESGRTLARVVFSGPYCCWFQIDEQEKRVTVTSFYRTPRG